MPAKVTVHDDVLATAIPDAHSLEGTAVNVTASNGMVVRLQEPDVNVECDMNDALDQKSDNPGWARTYLKLSYVVAINGEPVFRPSNMAEIRALQTRLGRLGLAAVVAGIGEHFSNTEEDAKSAARK